MAIQDTPRKRSHQGHGQLVDSRPGPVCPNVADDDLNVTSKSLNQNALLVDIVQKAQQMLAPTITLHIMAAVINHLIASLAGMLRANLSFLLLLMTMS